MLLIRSLEIHEDTRNYDWPVVILENQITQKENVMSGRSLFNLNVFDCFFLTSLDVSQFLVTLETRRSLAVKSVTRKK